MTQQFLDNMHLLAVGIIVLGVATVLVAVAFVWDGMQERKFLEEGFDFEWDEENQALARVVNHPANRQPFDQEGVR